jgi:acyl-CoA synthetase (AMP-forming)/AMP-acid ligase II
LVKLDRAAPSDERAPSKENSPEPSPTETLAALIERRAIESPGAVYLEDARSDRAWTYSQLARIASDWARYLGAIAPYQSSVIVDVGDPLHFAAAHLGIVASGRRSIPVNPDLSWDELVRISALAGDVALVVTDRETPGEIAGVTIGGVSSETGSPAGLAREGFDGVAAPWETDAPTGGVLLFTSGSTGEPKGVELPERQLMFVARAVADHNSLGADDRGYNPLPLFHVNAEVVGLLATLVAGATLVLDRRFHRTGFWELLRDRRITWLNAVPAMLAVLARGDSLDVPDTVRFIRSASAPLPDAVRATLEQVALVVSYGMTEGASQITATPLGEPLRPGSVGIPVGCEIEVRDEEAHALQRGEVGVLWIRGPGIIRGYYRGRVAERFDADGWLNTNDLGTIDDDGYVYLVGRADDVINRGGEKVYPAEVEDVLLRDDRVREAVVVARPDAILNQVPVAYVIPVVTDLDPAVAEQLAEELRERSERELPRFKRPVQISVVDDVPRAPTGKVQRNRVREIAAAK